MNQQREGCREELITALVQGTLEETLETQVAGHLSACVRCREALDAATESSDLWQNLRQTMSEQPFDEASDLISKSQIVLTIGRDDQIGSEQSPEPVVAPSIQHVLRSLAPTDDPEMLGRLGHHEVRGVIGAGGMGVVLKALDPSLDRMVAIKILAPHLATSGAARQRFAREAKAAAAVLHPNVVAIHGVSDGGSSGLPYLVMPYIRGMTLQARIDRDGSLTLTEILQVAVQVADGLAAAHEQGLVHRDIKPANIMLEDGVERVSIMDFGLARTVDDATLTQSGVIAGTPQYMSPEQARGDSIDARSDLFSLGSLLYVMAAGHPPFRAETAYGILRRITDETARPIREVRPDLPAWLEFLVVRLHSKSALARIDSASEVADVLRACLAHVQSSSSALPEAVTAARKKISAARFWSFGLSLVTLVVSLMIWLPGDTPFDQRSAGQESQRDVSVDRGQPGLPGENQKQGVPVSAMDLTFDDDDQKWINSFSWQPNQEFGELRKRLRNLDESTRSSFETPNTP